MKKIIYFLLILFFTSSCFFEDSDFEGKMPSEFKVTLNLNYSGTAKSRPFENRVFYFSLSGPTSKEWNYPYTTGGLNQGDEIPLTLEEGAYSLSGYWDWDESGDKDSYEPTVNKSFTVSSSGSIDCVVKDNTSRYDDCWITGTIYSDVQSSSSHYLYVILYENRSSKILQQGALGTGKLNPSSSPVLYNTGKIDSSIDYSLLVFWDLNDNGARDSNEPVGLETEIYSSPGLPTIVDFNLN